MANQSRRSNVIMRGLAETPRETWEQCEASVKEACVNKLGLDEDDVKNMHMERAHILPRNRPNPQGHPKDIIVKFSFFKDKERIVKAARTKRPDGNGRSHERCTDNTRQTEIHESDSD